MTWAETTFTPTLVVPSQALLVVNYRKSVTQTDSIIFALHSLVCRTWMIGAPPQLRVMRGLLQVDFRRIIGINIAAICVEKTCHVTRMRKKRTLNKDKERLTHVASFLQLGVASLVEGPREVPQHQLEVADCTVSENSTS